ncbi:MAG: quaternary ammonium compound efflux SMR transporter SugE [Lentisphaeria bacterium]|nr:quaternary ammonium compound efflux SMR transporter SugE [Lentisphaeria bacterium]
MNWFLLIIAGLLEVVWALSMKYSQCFTRLYPSIITIVAMVVSFVLLALAMRSLPLGTSYVVWTGIGAIGSVVVGILFFGESAAIPRLICIGLIMAGIIGLKILSGK